MERPTKEELEKSPFGAAIERGVVLMGQIEGRNPWETPEAKEEFTKDIVNTSVATMEELSALTTPQGGRDFLILFTERFPKEHYLALKEIQDNDPAYFKNIVEALVDALLIEDPARREEKIKLFLGQLQMKSEVEGNISELFHAVQVAKTEEQKKEVKEKAEAVSGKLEKLKKYGLPVLMVFVFMIILIILAAWHVAEKKRK